MGKYEKLLEQILLGNSDANVDFDELCQLLLRLGFETRVRRSHHIFRKQGVEERVNLQRDGNKAKVYQIRQVRSVILRYNLRGETNG
jgi:predicted RNA binding protein YcfA (HicA-like mRNA interferase family)